MKKTMAFWLAGILIVFMSVTGASAATYHDLFPSYPNLVIEGGLSLVPLSPTYGEIGGFDAVGEKVSQTFTNTGLVSVNGLRLDLTVLDDFNYQVDFNVTVNSISVGVWQHLAIDGAGTLFPPLQYVFEDIVGNGTYTIALQVIATNAPANLPSTEWFSLAYSIPYSGQYSPLLLAGTPPCPCPAPIPGVGRGFWVPAWSAFWVSKRNCWADPGLQNRLISFRQGQEWPCLLGGRRFPFSLLIL